MTGSLEGIPGLPGCWPAWPDGQQPGGLEGWLAQNAYQPKAAAAAPVNKRIASQQGWRTGGLESSSLEAWRAGWQLASQDANGLNRPAVALVNKRIASQQGWRTGGLEGSSLEAWRAGLEGGLQRVLAKLRHRLWPL